MEAIFSRWAVKRVCQFLLKKKLGRFILGDIDLDQLDVQLREGTIQLNDLALNVDYLNKKFGAVSSLMIKEGSIGSLLARMPWKGKGCQVEVDELELVLSPYVDNLMSDAVGSQGSSLDDNKSVYPSQSKPEKEMTGNAVVSSSGDVHEGVKTIAKMVKWLLTSFNVTIKKVVIAFDPYSSQNEGEYTHHRSMVFRVAELACGTCVSEDSHLMGNVGTENFLGISRLTNYVTFHGAILELLHMDDVNRQACPPSVSGTDSGGLLSGLPPVTSTVPIMIGREGGFSGTLKLSIPWKNGSLDIRKVDADVSIDPIELRFQPSTIKWILFSWRTIVNLCKERECGMQHKSASNVHFSSASGSPSSATGSSEVATNIASPLYGGLSVELSSSLRQGTESDLHLPNVISDWVPFVADKEEDDFGASVDQFFECFDELRSFQSALGGSGMWNWTCSVFSAITAASNLASGSLLTPSEQQHIETNLRVSIAGMSLMFSLHDEDDGNFPELNDDEENIGFDYHCLGAECRDISLMLQICPRDVKFEGTVKHIEVNEYISHRENGMFFGDESIKHGICGQNPCVRQLQAEVLGTLPPRASYMDVPENDLVGESAPKVPFAKRNDLIRIMLLRTSGLGRFQLASSSCLSDGSSKGPMSFSLSLPPFVIWVNFRLILKLLAFVKEMEKFLEVNDFSSNFQSEVKQESPEDLNRGPRTCITTTSSRERLQGVLTVSDARVVLCFPFDGRDDIVSYFDWDQFIALDFYSPFSTREGKVDSFTPFCNSNPKKRFSSMVTTSVHLNACNFDMYLVSAACEEVDDGGKSCRSAKGCKFSSLKILSVANCTPSSIFSMIWQEGPVTGAWVAERAKSFAVSEERSRNKFMGKGYEFASVTTLGDSGDTATEIRQDIIMTSSFLMHLHLSSAVVTLRSYEYEAFNCLLSQVIKGFTRVAFEDVDSLKKTSVGQTSIYMECDSVEIVIHPDKIDNIKSSIQNELPGSWFRLKLRIEKFELLNVSDIGGINGANFFWLAHGEGKLWGSITGAPDEEFLLISCCNSTMKRGDGGGSNALSTGLAGSDFVYMWDPVNFRGLLSITVRCGTFVAIGGRLDWFDAVLSFFTLPASETEGSGECSSSKGDCQQLPGSSFSLNLVDTGLSYEPYLKNLMVTSQVGDLGFSHSSVKSALDNCYVACIIAASCFSISNATSGDLLDTDYNIRAQDLGFLICSASELELHGDTYSVQHLHKIGYVKVAREALVLANLSTNCRNGTLWELECSNSHIDVETRHDSTLALIQLVTQLQQLFAPDLEESLVHLQSRWDNVQKEQERNHLKAEVRTSVGDLAPSTPQVHSSSANAKSQALVIGLMDEIREDAFLSDESRTCQYDSESNAKSFLGEKCDFDTAAPETLSQDLLVRGSVPLLGLESSQASFIQKGCFPDVIEGYCIPDPLCLSELSAGRDLSGSIVKHTSGIAENVNAGRGDSGWYRENSLRIRENHIADICEMSSMKQSAESKPCSPSSEDTNDSGKLVGRVIVKNINVRWRMSGGADWDISTVTDEHSGKNRRRDTAICLELALCGIDCQYDIYPVGGFCVSKLSFSVQDVHLYDRSEDATLRLVLGYYSSKDHPRESSSKALKLNLEAVRPDPLIPLEEYRLCIALLPLRLHLHQRQLDFLISFFGNEDPPQDWSSGVQNNLGGSEVLLQNAQSGSMRKAIVDEALLPYFQKFDIKPFSVRVDYIPQHLDLAALGGGKYVELVNLVPWKGIELHLKPVQAVGVYGWNNVCETIIGEWLEDISQNQIHKVLRGLPTIRSLISVGSAAAKLVSCPVENYKKDHRVLKGLQRGTVAFLRSISLEAVGLGVHLAAGAHDILQQAEYILASIPPSSPWPLQSRASANVRSNQPKDAQHGIKQAYECISDGLGKSASALVQTPLKKYQRGAGAGAAISTAFQAVPAATLAPVSACASAVHYALLGIRNSLDPEHKRESMEKYMGPNQPQE
ncbi:autophagy-related protein 2 isoform X2 [Rhodamnia argentea]|uniref:Autophagy-related protein 2 n=1 Tax=Rhodamnia argentea TaxID=178133 RepID=A0ABM3GWZ4_9MYRT|nr:autophagy-related protein 2 isoform X2 [Rhodamnia argentea]